MKCAIKDCDKTAPYPMPCCGMNHGVLLKRIRSELPSAFSGNDHNAEINDKQFHLSTPRHRYTIEDALHYQYLIR